MSLNWLDDALQNAAQQGEQVTEEEREFARGCQNGNVSDMGHYGLLDTIIESSALTNIRPHVIHV